MADTTDIRHLFDGEGSSDQPVKDRNKNLDNIRHMFDKKENTTVENNINVVQDAGMTPTDEVNASKFAEENNTDISVAREAVKVPEAGRVYPRAEERNSPSLNEYYRNMNNAGVSQHDSRNLLEIEREVNYIPTPTYHIDGEPLRITDEPQDEMIVIQKEAEDAIKNMSLTEKALREFDIGKFNLTLNRLGYQQVLNGSTPEGDAEIERFKQRIPQSAPDDNIIEGIATATLGMTPLVFDSLSKGVGWGSAYGLGFAATAALGGQVPPLTLAPEEVITVPAAAAMGYSVGSFYGASKNIYEQEAGSFWNEARLIRDVNGQPIDEAILRGSSLGYATISTGLELLGLKWLAKTIPGGEKLLGKITKNQALKVLNNPSFQKRAAELTKRFALGVIGEGETEEAQAWAQAMVEEIAKSISEKKDGAYFLPFDWENAYKSGAEARYEGYKAGFGFGTPGTTISGVKLASDFNQSRTFHNKIDKVNQAQNESQTWKMSPEHSRRFLNSTDLQKEAFISAEDSERLFQSKDPEAAAIVKKMNINVVEARQKAVLGQDITIDMHDALTELNDEELKVLQTYIKPNLDGFTSSELESGAAKERGEEIQEFAKETEADALVFQAGLDRIKRQIVDAGLTPEEAEANTTLVEKFANGLNLLGQDRTAFLEKLDIKKATFIKDIVDGERLSQEQLIEQKEKGFFKQAFGALKDIVTGKVRVDTSLKVPEGMTREEYIKQLTPEQVTLFQAQEGDTEPTGFVDFVMDEGREKAIISLLESSDASTLPHELGHVFLREMTIIEGTEGITDQFKADMGSVREWLGVAPDATALTVPQQEQFARGFEQWLRDGKAPNEQLATVFARFKRWLTEVYKRARSLDVELNNDIKQVFNRMLDTDSEAVSAAAVNGMVAPTTERMDNLGISNDEQFKLKKLVNDSVDKAGHELFVDRSRAVRENKVKFEEEAEREARGADVQGVYSVIDDIKDQLAEARTLPGIIAATKKSKRFKLSDAQVTTLQSIERLVSTGEFFVGETYTKEDTLKVINKVQEGKSLTVNQQILLEDLTTGYRERVTRESIETGEIETAEPRLNRQEFIELNGVDAIKQLPAQDILITDGRDLDEAAQEYGFDSGEEMMQAFLNTPPLQEAIDFRVALKNQQLEDSFIIEDYLAKSKGYAEYIDLMNGHLTQAADRAIKAEVTGKPIKRIASEEIKAQAFDIMTEKSVSEAQQTHLYLNAMKKAGIAMAEAERAKDFAKSIRESNKMAINKELANLSVKNKKEVTAFVNRAKKFRKLGSPKNVSYRYREGVRRLIENFSILPNVAPQKPKKIDMKALMKPDEYVEFFPSDFLLSDKIRDYRKMTMLEMKEIDNLIAFFKKQGKVEHEGLLSDGFTVLQEVGRGSMAEMDAEKGIHVFDQMNPWRKLNDPARKKLAEITNISFITAALGGYQSLTGGTSVIEQNVTERLKDLTDEQSRRSRLELGRIKEHNDHIVDAQRKMIKKYGRKLFVADNKVPVPALLQKNGAQLNYWTPEQIFSMAFNRGNDSNTNALIAGFDGLTLGQVDSLLNKYLTIEDIDAVQGILDVMEGMFKDTDEVHLKMKGYRMERIKPREWTFKEKKYKGGYYPLAIDRYLASTNTDVFTGIEEAENWFEGSESQYTVPFASDSFGITRKDGHALPLDLRLHHVHKHIDKVTRYITMAEGARDIYRIVTYTEKVPGGSVSFKKSAVRLMGKDMYDQIIPAVKLTINPRLKGVDVPGDKFIGWLRAIATSKNLALKISTGLKQPFSIFGGIHDMGRGDGGGFKAFIKGAGHVLASPSVAFSTMREKSAFMHDRINQFERDILRPQFKSMTPAKREITFGDRNITWKDVQDAAFITVTAPDISTVTPIWWGSYLDKLNSEGTNEKEAIRYADNIIRHSQPTAAPIDRSKWFNKNGFWSIFNLHQTFTVGTYGPRQRTWFRAWKSKKVSTAQYVRFNMMDAVVPMLLMQTMVSWLRSGELSEQEEWEDIVKNAAQSWLFMGIPMADTLFTAVTAGTRRDVLQTPGAGQVNRWLQTANLIIGGDLTDKEKEQAYWGLADMISDISRVPISRVVRQVSQGETIKEKAFGKKRKKSKK